MQHESTTIHGDHQSPCTTAQRLTEQMRTLESWQNRQNDVIDGLSDDVRSAHAKIDSIYSAVMKAQWAAIVGAGGVILTLALRLAGVP